MARFRSLDEAVQKRQGLGWLNLQEEQGHTYEFTSKLAWQTRVAPSNVMQKCVRAGGEHRQVYKCLLKFQTSSTDSSMYAESLPRIDEILNLDRQSALPSSEANWKKGGRIWLVSAGLTNYCNDETSCPR